MVAAPQVHSSSHCAADADSRWLCGRFSFNRRILDLGVALQLKGDVPTVFTEYTKAQQLSDDLGAPVLLANNVETSFRN